MIRTQTRAWLAPAAVALALFAPRVVHAQRQVIVNIDSLPQGAAVRVDSETNIPIGTTPLRRVRVPVGSHTLYFTREGFLPGRLDVQIQRRNETFAATLTQGGSVYVSADVDGAQVFLDGNAVGTTPGRINNVPPGQHVIEIRQQGIPPFRDTVTVGPGAVASVNASLRPPAPAAQPTGMLLIPPELEPVAIRLSSIPHNAILKELERRKDKAKQLGQKRNRLLRRVNLLNLKIKNIGLSEETANASAR